MKREPVKSGNIVSIGHDPEKNVMEVEFRGGTVYLYHDVDADKHAALLKANSIGKHFHAHIRGGHKFTKG